MTTCNHYSPKLDSDIQSQAHVKSKVNLEDLSHWDPFDSLCLKLNQSDLLETNSTSCKSFKIVNFYVSCVHRFQRNDIKILWFLFRTCLIKHLSQTASFSFDLIIHWLGVYNPASATKIFIVLQ